MNFRLGSTAVFYSRLILAVITRLVCVTKETVEQKQNDPLTRGSLPLSSVNFEHTPALARNEKPAIEGGTYVNVSGS